MINNTHPVFDPKNSPLQEAKPTTLNDFMSSERLSDIMNMPVLNRQKQDTEDVVRYYQRMRLKFLECEASDSDKTTEKKRKKALKADAGVSQETLDLLASISK
jgi:hypothetical protein